MATVVFRPSGVQFTSDSSLTPGPTTIWSDDSDLTYSEVFDADSPISGAITSFIPTFDPIPAMLYGVVTGVSIDIRAAGVSTETIFMTVQDTGYWPTDTFFHPTPTIVDFTWVPTSIANANALANAMAIGLWFPAFIAVTSNADVTQKVYEITVTVDYIPAPRAAPARRLYPRDSEHARIYPPPTSPQSGVRFGPSSTL